MASHNDLDGLHVQSIEQVQSPARFPMQTKDNSHYDTKILSSPQPYQYDYSQKEASPPYNPSRNPAFTPRRNPWGLSPLLFASLVALTTALVVGVAVGGGLGAALSAKKACATSISSGSSSGTSTSTVTVTASGSSPTSSSTTVLTNYAPAIPSTVESLSSTCATLGGSITSAQNTVFSVTCGQAILGGEVNDDQRTLSELLAYTFQDCVNACSLMNSWKGSGVCNSVTWDSGLAGAITAYGGGNCWLFNNSTVTENKANSTSARLQST